MEHEVDLELGEHAIEERRVGDRSGELALDERRERAVERGDVERDDRPAIGLEPCNEPVPNLAAGAGD